MAKLYYGQYGHNPSGKQYVYWGSDNFRTGQHVVAPVTNKWTGRTYNTMFTIQRTSGGEMGQNEAERLNNQGIDVKWISGRDTLSLPSGSQYVSKADWERSSNQRYEDAVRQRLMSYQGNNSELARTRLLN
jgi:hypothetical protein